MIISENELIKTKRDFYGNKYLIGNGYMGYRGTLDEDDKTAKVALNLNGIYDKVIDKWCESVNTYNPLYTNIYINDLPITSYPLISHTWELDISKETLKRITTYEVNDTIIKVTSTRFASFASSHILGCKYQISSSKSLDLKVKTGIDFDIWELNGPHLLKPNIDCKEDCLIVTTKTQEKATEIVIKEHLECHLHHELEVTDKAVLHVFNLVNTSSFSFKKIIEVNTSLDDEACNENELVYDKLYKAHLNIYETLFKQSNVNIIGEEKAQIAISYSIYQLLIASPRNVLHKSVPARALSGQVYKGAVFWDTEMFMLPFYLLTDLVTSRNLIVYRIEGLAGAKLKAKEFGYTGAFYAWEATTNGIDECSLYNMTDELTNKKLRTYFKDKQIHISGDVLYGLIKYYEATLDDTILINGGFEMALEIIKFYYSKITFNHITKTYDVLDVTGPDEYHERVNNNAYTNKLITYCFTKTKELGEVVKKINPILFSEIINKTSVNDIYPNLTLLAKKITQPQIIDGVIEQFSGYFNLEDIALTDLINKKKTPNEYLGGEHGLATPTKIIKQADVITMLYMFKEDYDERALEKNFNYYLPKTEHGSTLSHSMYALVACLIKKPNYAYPYFLHSGLIDYIGGAKEYAGGIYIGGTHPASSGGTYMCIIYGFTLMNYNQQGFTFTSNLPEAIEQISFYIRSVKTLYHVVVRKEKIKVEEVRE